MNTTPVAPTAPRDVAAARSSWSGGRIAAFAIGALLVLVSLCLLGAGGTGLWADLTQRDDGYVTTDAHNFTTAGAALATEPTHLGSAGVEWLYAPGLLGKIRVRVTPVDASAPLFVGIGRSTDVDRYLAGVGHTQITDFWKDDVRTIAGGTAPARPGVQHFWAASTSGSGAQTLTWHPKSGSWSVVVMNADARPGVAVGADLGARIPALVWIAVGVLAGGVLLLAGGALLVLGAVRTRGPRTTRRSDADDR